MNGLSYKSKSFILLLILSFIISACRTDKSASCFKELPLSATPLPKKVCFKEHCFIVELANTYQERERGLMYREHLDNNKGMLFIYEEEGMYNFWMKNTIIPLDMIWISKDREVVFIAHNVMPCFEEPCPVIYPNRKAMYVLEVNAGCADRIDLKISDKACFE